MKPAPRQLFVYEHFSGGGLAHDAAAAASDAAADDLLLAGTSMRDALVADLLTLDDYGVSVATCARATPVPESATPLTPRPGESAFTFVARQAALHDLLWVIAPETGGLLEQFAHLVGGPRWLGCSAAAIGLAASKQATSTRAAAAGVLTPLAFEHAPETRRWVVKPDDGAGAVATRLHADRQAARDDRRHRLAAGVATVAEPWVDGEPLSLSLLCGVAGTELLSVNRQRLHVDAAGWLAFDGVDIAALAPADARHRTLARWAAQVAACIPGLRGFVGIDLVWHAQRGPVLIEVNPRLTCAYVGLSAALGRNLAGEAIAAIQHRREAALAGA